MPPSILLADIPLSKSPSWSAADFLTSPVLPFLLTIAIEWPLLAWWSGMGLRKTAPFAVLANGFTWGVAMGVLTVSSVPIPLVETGVIAMEALLLMLLWRWRWWRAILVSLGMNLASWLGGTTLLRFLLSRS